MQLGLKKMCLTLLENASPNHLSAWVHVKHRGFFFRLRFSASGFTPTAVCLNIPQQGGKEESVALGGVTLALFFHWAMESKFQENLKRLRCLSSEASTRKHIYDELS